MLRKALVIFLLSTTPTLADCVYVDAANPAIKLWFEGETLVYSHEGDERRYPERYGIGTGIASVYYSDGENRTGPLLQLDISDISTGPKSLVVFDGNPFWPECK